MKYFLTFLFVTLPLIAIAQQKPSHWFCEAEDEGSKVTFNDNGVIDIIAPKGLTLWYKKPLDNNAIIEYDARIVVEEGNNNKWNRLSDLNCFWMATDPDVKNGSVLKKAKERKGIFLNQYALKMYYVGYGGNHNTTTRFRRYQGDKRGIKDANFRPAILTEYKDSTHLLKPNHWYHIRLLQSEGIVSYVIDGETIVEYKDNSPITHGYFGFRTTLSHAQIKNINIKRVKEQKKVK